MGKYALLFATALALLRAASSAPAQMPSSPQSNPASNTTLSVQALNRVVGYTAWDEDYFYIALQINKPTLNGKNSEPFSNPLEDDAALISLQSDDDHKSSQRTARSVLVAVSAAGGAQLYSGPDKKPLFKGFADIQSRLEQIGKDETDPVAQQAKRAALLSSLIKFKVVPLGASLPGGARVSGYTLEVAIPWTHLGGRPQSGAKMGFLVAAQSTAPGSPALQSLSPKVRGGSDLDNPSLWSEIVFSNTPDASVPGAILCPRVFASKPVVDGELTTGEWNTATAFEFGERLGAGAGTSALANTLAARIRPEFVPRPPRPVVPLPAASVDPPALPPHRPQRVTPLVLAPYAYWFQADSRKAAPLQQVQRPDGSTALIHHPMDGVGPWFSFDRAGWHRRQLMEIRRAGIDVILPIYRGSPRDRQLYAEKGLMTLVEALNALRQAGQEYPQVALYLDTNSLIETLGDRPDLRDPAAQAALYGMIRDFYRAIPEPFRCVVPLSAENGGRRAYPVFLSDASAFTAFDASFATAVRGRFAADFGADLVLLGESGFKPKAALDGYFTEAKEKGGQFDGGGWIKTASVGAGYDNTLAGTSGSDKPLFRSRRDGQTYRDDWMAALGKQPDWVLISSWNDYTNGAEVASTLETGFSYADLTRVYSRMFGSARPGGAKFLWHDVPAVMRAQATYTVHFRAQNTGAQGWGPTSASDLPPVGFAYRWKRGDQVVATSAAVPLSAPALAGQNVEGALAVATTGPGGAALPPGDYTLEIGAVEINRKGEITNGLSNEGRARLQIPVRLRAADGGEMPEWAASLVRTDLPRMLEAGGVYEVHATLRNDGARPWRKSEGARVTLRLYKTTPRSGGGLSQTPVAAADATAMLTQDVLPGQEANVRLLLPLTDPEGNPLPAWNQEQPWTYAAAWEVAADAPRATSVQPVVAAGGAEEARPAAQGVSLAPTPIAMVEFDFGVRFTADGTLSTLPAEKRIPVRLSLQNVGPQTWKKDTVRVGYHWYYLDGTEYLWEDETTGIPQDVPPGGKVTDMMVWVTAPPNDGTYWLVWDVKVGDTWASTTASTRVFDEIVNQVQVVRGHLTFADLSRAYNLNGVTHDYDLAGGDFDGAGHTFPAMLIPPFASTDYAPSSVWLPVGKTGPESSRRISFRWGPKDGRSPNFIACRGQKVLLGKSGDQCRLLHLVAASTGKDSFANVKLIFQEPNGESEDVYAFGVSRWDRPPAGNDEIAFLARRHHARSGLEPGAVALYHYTIHIREPRKLIAIQLPDAPEIKIAAITLEK